MLDFLVALFTSALAGTGVGGGGLYVIYLTLVRGTEQLKAQGINLAFFITGAMSSMLLHIRKRHFAYRLVFLVGGCGAVGALLGALLAQHLDTSLLSKIFGAMLVFCGIRVFFVKPKK